MAGGEWPCASGADGTKLHGCEAHEGLLWCCSCCTLPREAAAANSLRLPPHLICPASPQLKAGTDFRLNVRLTKACTADVQRLCKGGCGQVWMGEPACALGSMWD